MRIYHGTTDAIGKPLLVRPNQAIRQLNCWGALSVFFPGRGLLCGSGPPGAEEGPEAAHGPILTSNMKRNIT